MNNKIIMAFDYGIKKIGIAIGNNIINTITILKTISSINGKPNWEKISKLIKNWIPDLLLVGLPINIDNTESKMSLLSRKFGKELKKKYCLPYKLVDERISTYEAKYLAKEEIFYTKKNLDGIAASIIMNDFLNK
ncbi:Putative Holliday junction resolvase [Candidatus Portiera aleyrodidarum]|uniref:Holliday junction resolvase RuvX n=1 Tax=Candidatus Portiera aleyrodidarum TaxID=91844 RepID=UPI0005D85023|nr:Holliday junction resolvase RuvX [Candidatus Portiera aleyrodidarum]CEL12515.1 Putative Holliday junction resolvase [Candidatus Portiera aleyrodidarum]